MRNKTIRSVGALLFAALFLLLSVSCTSGAGVSPACAGYAAGKEGEIQYDWHGKDRITLPYEVVRCFALYTAASLTERSFAAAEVVYNYDDIYMKDVVLKSAGTPRALLDAMNRTAGELGLSLVFSSLTGTEKSEEALYKCFDEDSPLFEESTGNLLDLKKLAEIFYADPLLGELLSRSKWQFDGMTASKTRIAPLLVRDGQYGVDSAQLYLSGNAFRNGKASYLALAAVKEGEDCSFSAVLIQSGSDSPINYGAVDAGNLCGRVLDKNYRLAYLPTNTQSGSGAMVGGAFYRIGVYFFLVLAGILLILVIISGVFTRIKRNAEGRKKYAAKVVADQPNDAPEEENGKQTADPSRQDDNGRGPDT